MKITYINKFVNESYFALAFPFAVASAFAIASAFALK